MSEHNNNIDILINILICLVFFIIMPVSLVLAEDESQKNSYYTHPDYQKFMPKVIGILPMDNLSLEPEIETFLYHEVYNRLIAKGYIRVSTDKILENMGKLGIQTPGQISGISPQTLGKELGCDAILRGGIEQSAAVHGGVYDAVVVSCSLYLIHCPTGEVLWSCEQWRTAHRQWQLDPFNALINIIAHEKSSRKDRVAWLVHEMLKTFPDGPIRVVNEDLLNQAVEIKSK